MILNNNYIRAHRDTCLYLENILKYKYLKEDIEIIGVLTRDLYYIYDENIFYNTNQPKKYGTIKKYISNKKSQNIEENANEFIENALNFYIDLTRNDNMVNFTYDKNEVSQLYKIFKPQKGKLEKLYKKKRVGNRPTRFLISIIKYS